MNNMKKGKSAAAIAAAILLVPALGAVGWLLYKCGLFDGKAMFAAAGCAAVLTVAVGFLLCGSACQTRSGLLWSALLCVLAVALRLLFLDIRSGEYVQLSGVIEYLRNNGGFRAIKDCGAQCGIAYTYVLALISMSPLPDIFLIKLVSAIFEFLAAFFAMKIAQRLSFKSFSAPLTFFIVLFLPTVVINGSMWAQCDSIYTALCLGALFFVICNKEPLAMLFLGLSLAFKLQTVFILPLWGVLLAAGILNVMWVVIVPVAFALAALPAVLMGMPVMDVVGYYIDSVSAGRPPVNTPSVFPLIQRELPEFGLVLGIAAAVALCILLMLLGGGLKGRMTERTVCAYALAITLAVPFLLPGVHERCFYLPGILAVALAASQGRFIPVAVLAEAASLMCYLGNLEGLSPNVFIASALMAAAALYALILAVVSGEKKHRKND